MISGARPFVGQAMPMSLASVVLVPVLSPTRQPTGRPARRRLPPVVLSTSHCCRRSREAGERTSPSSSFCRVSAMARGVVVSSKAAAVPSFSAVSWRSRRVVSSPTSRAKRVSAAGPP